jgi:iron(III) transport system substrate-binding protein
VRAERRDLLATLAALAAAAALPRAFAQATADWPAITEAAKKEGRLFVYTAAAGQTAHGLVAKAFEKKYGIAVSFLEARASELRERVRSEQAAGRFIGDVSHNGSTTSTLQAQEGAFQPFGALPGLARLRAPFKADALRMPVFASAYAILVNTQLVKPADAPKSWQDLTDPKWKGRILCDDMRALGGGAVTFFVLQEKLGRGFHERLAANAPVFSRDLRASERRVARGEYAVWIPMTSNNVAEMKGLPVKLIVPSEGMPYITYELALLKNAPHPNAARLFMEFFLSDEAQAIHAAQGLITVTTLASADGAKPPPLLGTTEAARQDEMLKLAKEIYK